MNAAILEIGTETSHRTLPPLRVCARRSPRESDEPAQEGNQDVGVERAGILPHKLDRRNALKLTLCSRYPGGNTPFIGDPLARPTQQPHQRGKRTVKPAPFDYVRPDTLDEALQLLASSEGEARILAGGQSLVAMMNLRFARPSMLIDINGFKELDFHRCEDGVLRIGALARHATVAGSPLVREVAPLITDAYRYVAHHTVRNRGTLAGNLCHADPASEMPAVMLVLDAEFALRSATGERVVRARDFFLGPYTTAASADEMLVEIRIPAQKAGSAFEEMSVRQGDFALTLVASTLTITDGKIKSAQVAYAGIGTCATLAPEVEQILVGQPPSDEVFSRAAEAAVDALSLTSDVHADIEYRQDLIRTLTPRALRRASQMAQA